MSAKSLHLNLLNPHEIQSSSPVRLKFILPITAGIILAATLVWCGFIGVQYAYISICISQEREKVSEYEAKHREVELLKLKANNLQSEVDQYLYYINGRRTYGTLLRQIALVIPETITLDAMTIPEPPKQALHPPIGSKLPVLQGPTNNTEAISLRLTGLAKSEQDVFQLMTNLKSEMFTNSIIITKNNVHPNDASPKVLAFRQEAPRMGGGGKRGVFFDLEYTLKPREFKK